MTCIKHCGNDRLQKPAAIAIILVACLERVGCAAAFKMAKRVGAFCCSSMLTSSHLKDESFLSDVTRSTEGVGLVMQSIEHSILMICRMVDNNSINNEI